MGVQAETVSGMNGSTALEATTIVTGRPAAPLSMLTARSTGSLRIPAEADQYACMKPISDRGVQEG
jgi:hypothetical protein